MQTLDFQYQFGKIQTDDSLMETVLHGSEEYPFRFYYEHIAGYDFNCIDWHWHTELEFVYIEEGTVSCCAGDKEFELCAGNGVMVNSKILHRFWSEKDAVIPNFLFQPSFIAPKESLIYEKYVSPVLSSSLEYIVFRPEIPWQAEALEIIKQIIELQTSGRYRELLVAAGVQRLWSLILKNIAVDFPQNRISAVSRTRLQQMMRYIQDHYPGNITLGEIAEAAGISKSTALQIFRENLKMTPVNYLICYRLKQAARLLANTEKKVTAISLETGFSGADHFCRSFKKTYKATPGEYRRRSASK